MIGVVILYTTYQHSSTTENKIAASPQIQNIINSTVQQPIGNGTHRVIHITLSDGVGVQSP